MPVAAQRFNTYLEAPEPGDADPDAIITTLNVALAGGVGWGDNPKPSAAQAQGLSGRPKELKDGR